MAVRPATLPASSLLQRYARDGHYTDCWTADIAARVTHAQYVTAFYTSWVFRLERWILRWALARPSSDDEAARLGSGTLERFSAWRVEARAENQLLTRDEFTGRTGSWLMSEPQAGGGTRLYFGSVVVSEKDGRMGNRFSLLLGFHKLYSRILLGAAARRLR